MAGYQFRLTGYKFGAFGHEVAMFDEPDLAQRFQALISEAMVKTGKVFNEHPWEGAFAVVLATDERNGHLILGFEPESPRSDAEFENAGGAA